MTHSSTRCWSTGVRRRLDDEHVRAPDVLVDLERDLAVRKPMQPSRPERQARGARQSPAPAPDGRCPRTTSADRGSCSVTVRSPPSARRQRGTDRQEIGWGGRIRTFEYGIQSPAPYRLATPHPGPHTCAVTDHAHSGRQRTRPQTRESITGPCGGPPPAGTRSRHQNQPVRSPQLTGRRPTVPSRKQPEDRRPAAGHPRCDRPLPPGRPRPSRR